ncbi:L,D-transpeptidase [Sporichthya polymorpha]|uniref:L,D-transpeptidase n=1 Tax=Sporichthya polymorpha TaxID=35751 RepID=UPI00037D8AC3|nr:Ig-like domain-containing protein [Sporichthya polymorpha]
MRRVIALVASPVLAIGLLAGCGGDEASSGSSGPMSIAVTPAADARNVGAGATVKVTGSNGRLTEVRVTDGKSDQLDGRYAPDRTAWNSTVPVKVGTRYTVHAWGEGADGAPVEKITRFSTTDVKRSDTLEIASVQPENGAKVGVGHPLMVTFNQPVEDRKIVQKALQVRTTPRVEGAWYWIDDVTVDYRPEKFWPAGTKVTLAAKLKDIQAGDGVLGGANRRSTFTVDRAQIITVDVDKHKLTVERDGKPLKTYDVTTGKKGWETRTGTKIVMDKERNKKWTDEAIDAPEDYEYRSKYAMRITNSGEFLHDAPWNRGTIGEANTSHGCIGLLPEAAEWLYQNTIVGDPVVVVGSSRPFDDLLNRVADWTVPWEKWKAGNADQT